MISTQQAGADRSAPIDIMQRYLSIHEHASLDSAEREAFNRALSHPIAVEPRVTLVTARRRVNKATLLLEGILCRYIDDKRGLRQLVAVHIPGEFVDLHGYPMKVLDHSIASLTRAKIATVEHAALDRLIADHANLQKKLWFSTLLDAALHRAWLFRVGRLDSVGRVAHFLSEMNARLYGIGLSDGRSFAMGITQMDIAEICGLTSVHVNRCLRELRETGLCVFRSSTVELLNPTGLAQRGQFNPHYLYLRSRP